MSELEPDDSRNVTLRNERAPGEPPRTGPREGETRKGAQGQRQSQGGARESNWRADEAATADREAQDHEQAAGAAAAPSLRPEADGGQWSQQASDEDRQQQPDDSLHGGGDPRQAEQAERGGG